ncbi:MAG: hypothetical protein AAGF23_10995 [Acidobacteriota bacterium]
MASVLRPAVERGLLSAPAFVSGGLQYEVVLGSVAYGVSDDRSDLDIYGFCVPPRDEVFPHLRGEIIDFDKPPSACARRTTRISSTASSCRVAACSRCARFGRSSTGSSDGFEESWTRGVPLAFPYSPGA